MKNLLLELYDLVKTNHTLFVQYEKFIDTIEHFEKHGGVPKLGDELIVRVFLTVFAGFSAVEYKFITTAENAQEVYDFLLEQARIEHLVGGYEPSEGLMQ